jgi:hypothetical protein
MARLERTVVGGSKLLLEVVGRQADIAIGKPSGDIQLKRPRNHGFSAKLCGDRRFVPVRPPGFHDEILQLIFCSL